MKKIIKKIKDTGTGFLIEGYEKEMFQYKDNNWKKMSIKLIEEKAKANGYIIEWI